MISIYFFSEIVMYQQIQGSNYIKIHNVIIYEIMTSAFHQPILIMTKFEYWILREYKVFYPRHGLISSNIQRIWVAIFVAFCSFFPFSLTVVHRGRQWKSSRAGQQNIFFNISAWFQYRIMTQKCNKTSCCIVAWSRQTFWSKLNFLLPKNESVLNILVYFLEQFQRFSRGLQPLENL